MSALSNRTGSDSEDLLDGQDNSFEGVGGWDGPDLLDGYTSNQNVSFKLIKIANKRVSLDAIFRQYRIGFEFVSSGQGWTKRRKCPFPDHKDDTPSFGYNPDVGKFHCFGCSRGGKAVEFLAAYQNLEPLEVAKKLLYDADISDDEISADLEAQENKKISELLFEFSDYFRNFIQTFQLNAEAVQYAEKVAWLVEIYIRKNAIDGVIKIDQLQGRINKVKNRLELYKAEKL